MFRYLDAKLQIGLSEVLVNDTVKTAELKKKVARLKKLLAAANVHIERLKTERDVAVG